jgi:hypothetical protein
MGSAFIKHLQHALETIRALKELPVISKKKNCLFSA